MKNGSAELAIASSLDDTWDRLDTWPLFTEDFVLVVGGSHHLAGCSSVKLSDLRDETLLMRTCTEHFESLANVLRSQDFAVDRAHEVPCSRYRLGSSAYRFVIRRGLAAADPRDLLIARFRLEGRTVA